MSVLTKRGINSTKLAKLTNICTTGSPVDTQMRGNLNAGVPREPGGLCVMAPVRIVMEFEKNVDKKRGKKARNSKLSDKRKQSSYRFSSELNLTG